MGVAWVTWPNFEILGPPNNVWTKKSYTLEICTDIEDGTLRVDHKTNNMPKWAWLGPRDLISKFWDPLIILERIEAIRFKFGTEIEDEDFLRMEYDQ